jgi:hypothetical protein
MSLEALDLSDLKVLKETLAQPDLKVFKESKETLETLELTAPLVLQVQSVRLGRQVAQGFKDLLAPQVQQVIKAPLVLLALKESLVLLDLRGT